MHHPGPPRFVSVGDAVDLAPRDPDPEGTYAWRIEHAPNAATVELGDAPVQTFRPDAPGSYTLSLSAPDGVHTLTVRCFPGPPASDPRPPARSGPAGGGGLHVATGDRGHGGNAGRGRSYRGEPRTGDRAAGGGHGRPRVRLDGRIEGDTLVIEADPRPNPASTGSPADLDVEFVLDDRDAVDAAAATVEGRRLRLPAGSIGDRLRVHAVAVGEGGHSVPDAIEARRAASGAIEVCRLQDPPSWATDATYYEVYVRTFAPEAPAGERLAAVADRLGHLADLGIDVLWLTPVLEHDGAPHGYNVTDFFSIAPDLGDREAYRRLIERAHDRGINVLFDLVLNHSARDHPYFRQAFDDPGSEYREWYEWQDSGEPGTYFEWEHIANFDFDSLAVRRHLLDVVDAWAPLVDGFRCDMAWAVPGSFWREVRDRVKAQDPDFLLLDETIPYVPDFHGVFDVHFDSTTYATTRSVGAGWEPAESLLDAVAGRREAGFPDHAGFLLYAENHDETRYLTECGRPEAFAVAGALCTLPGAPLVYAGQEFGQLGKRDDLDWESADRGLTDHYRRLLALRRSMPALAADADLCRVDYDVRTGNPERVLAYGRAASTVGSSEGAPPGEATAAVVVCNFGTEPATVSPEPGVRPVDAATLDEVGTTAGVRVDDVVVLPTEPSELP